MRHAQRREGDSFYKNLWYSSHIMHYFLMIIVATFFGVGSVTAEASTVIRSGPVVSVANDQIVEENFYAWSNMVTISGEMAGDVVVAGGTVTVNGQVAHDILAAGGTVNISGEVGDDVRVVAGEVLIEGDIVGSLTVLGGSVKLLSDSTVAGDVVVYGGDVILEGVVEGQLLGTVNTLRLNGEIGGDIDISVDTLTLGDRAVLAGNLTYVSQTDLVRAANASISGQITRNDPVSSVGLDDFLQFIAITAIMILFGTLTLFLVARQRVFFFSEKVLQQPLWLSVLIGMAVFITVPFIVGLLLISTLGALVGVVTFMLYGLLLLISVMLLPVTIGSLMATVFQAKMQKMFLLWIVAGTGVLMSFPFLSLVGLILFLTFLFISFGVLAQSIFFWLVRDSIKLR